MSKNLKIPKNMMTECLDTMLQTVFTSLVYSQIIIYHLATEESFAALSWSCAREADIDYIYDNYLTFTKNTF